MIYYVFLGGGGRKGYVLREFIPFGALDNVVEDEDCPVVAGLEDEHVLVFGLFVVQDLVDFESHGLAWPHVGNFSEPAICVEKLVS